MGPNSTHRITLTVRKSHLRQPILTLPTIATNIGPGGTQLPKSRECHVVLWHPSVIAASVWQKRE
jgi:hypothetical protein